ncbi:glycoside hydrolase family 24 protein [Vreelandella sp. EE22]
MSAQSPAHWYEEVDLERTRSESSENTRPENVTAFLDMLAHAEGTPRHGSENGYNVLVGGEVFDGYQDHPRRLVSLPAYGISSTAAGRYQFLEDTWDDLVDRVGLPDFSPESQNQAAIELIRQCQALSMIHEGRIREAIDACRTIWASLPEAGYGQRELASDELVLVYQQAGGVSASA